MRQEQESYGLYIHVPFCLRKCPYCDFTSFDDKTGLQRDYFNALQTEIRICKAKTLDTIFIGGGTPSCIEAELIAAMLDECRTKFHITDGAEITIESNPATLTPEKLRVYRSAGISRVSMGVQSMVDAELRALGRLHSAEQVKESFALMRQAGFCNLNLDVMFGIPGQTLESLRSTLEQICAMGPEHISAYSLIVEPATRFFERSELGTLSLPDEDTERRMYDCVIDTLQKYGYLQYEISNFARPGYECRHNLKYWTCRPYLGLGLAAHGYDGNSRYYNTGDLKKYIGRLSSGSPVVEERIGLAPRDRIVEFIIMGLRLCKGIELVEFERRFSRNFLAMFQKPVQKFCQLGLMRNQNGRIYLTREGFSVSNSILCEFV